MIKVNKADIIDAMKVCSPGVSKGKSPIKGADTFTFKDGIVYSFNDDISVSVPIPCQKLNGSVKAEEALKLFTKLRTHEVEISVRENYWKIKSGNTEARLKLYSENCLDRIESLDIDNLDMHEIPYNFSQALSTCSLLKNKSKLEGIAISGGMMFSSDFERMSFYQLATAMPEFWIGEIACKSLTKLRDITHYAITSRWAHFKTSDNAYFSVRLIPCVIYPFIEMTEIYKEHRDLYGVDASLNDFPADMKGAVERVAAITDTYETQPLIELTFDSDGITLNGDGPAGKISEKLLFTEPFQYEVHAEALMTADFLKEAVSKSSRFFFTEDCRLVVVGESFLQIISGMSY